MKKVYYTLLFLLATTVSIAQGISVQGIARDAAGSAMTNLSLTFTFSITKDDNTVLYAETQSIKTDLFGVFSHIVKTGNPLNSTTFNDIDFKIEDLKLIVSVDYNSNAIEVYNQTFQYSPYAHYAKRAASADNGVPTGSIMPYVGEIAPEGWALCDGRSIASVANGAALRALIGDFTPDLRGVFLRGTGGNAKTGYTTYEGPDLKDFQKDANKEHLHAVDIDTNSQGEHSHEETATFVAPMAIGILASSTVRTVLAGVEYSRPQTDKQGKHTHNVNGETENSGSESRPVNYGVNYIIKL
jgi:microcystin-dependent protein